MNADPGKVKAQFRLEGVSVAEWARQNGFSAKLVYRVLSGDLRCSRGQSYKIACKLGLKEVPREFRYRNSKVPL